MHPPYVHRTPHSPDRADHLLIAAPNRLTHDRLHAMLAGARVPSAETNLGLRVDCRRAPWPRLLESLSLALSPMERRDTRVAVIPPGCDELTARHAAFCSRSFETLLDEWTELWVADLLASDRIRIDVQPILQYPPGRLHGYECLMRGVDEDGSLIPPSRVFASASKLGLVSALELKCRNAAIALAGRIYQQTRDDNLRFFINFVPSAVQEPMATLRTTVAELDRAGLKPSQITFEVVETDKVEDTRRLLALLRCFRKAGFRVALDDVGAGYASLLSLSTLRPDYIKLDGELVRRAAHSPLERKLVADLAETARQNGIITIAEGIETEHEFRVAYSCGIRVTQGYYHARPAPRPLTDLELAQSLARLHAAHPTPTPHPTSTAA